MRAEVSRLQENLAQVSSHLAKASDEIVILKAQSHIVASPDMHPWFSPVLTPPPVRWRALSSAHDGKALFYAYSLAPPTGKQYQLWFIADGKPVSAGVFDVDREGNGSLLVDHGAARLDPGLGGHDRAHGRVVGALRSDGPQGLDSGRAPKPSPCGGGRFPACWLRFQSNHRAAMLLMGRFVMQKKFVLPVAVAFFALLLSSSMASAADNWLGTWKMNAAKSKFVSGAAPKSQTLKFEAASGAIKLTSDSVDAAGKAAHSEYTAKFDGTDAAWTGNPNADSAAPKRVDANTYENVWKLGGKVTVTAKVVVSADGKTLTITQSGKDAKGGPIETTTVYDRQ